MLRLHLLATIAILFSGLPTLVAQQGNSAGSAGRAAVNPSPAPRGGQPAAPVAGQAQSGQPNPPQVLSDELKNLLSAWATASARIDRLEGQHLLREYDETYAIERLSEGHFYFEAPDKGRLDVHPVHITDKMLEERKDPNARVKRKADHTPYELRSGLEQKWICDGTRVYDIAVESNQVQVMALPAEFQGRNIMNSPLPFLFGMPPEMAVQRFDLSFSRPLDPATGFAFIRAVPRTNLDNWKFADIQLSLQSFLPAAVQITDSAGTTISMYRFGNMKVNKDAGLIGRIFGKDPFVPDLSGMEVTQVPAGPPGNTPSVPRSIADNPLQDFVVPNLTGMEFTDAIRILERVGFQYVKGEPGKSSISLLEGPPARKEEDVYRVLQQSPEPGTPVLPETRVVLKLWTRP